MSPRTTVIFFCMLLAFGLRAEPSNVLVGDLTFTRPERWKWESPSAKSTAQTRFIVPVLTGSTMTDVRFYVEEKDGKHSDEAWKELFGSAKTVVQQETKRIGKRQLFYLSLRGSYITGPKAKAKPGTALLSATIPFGEQVIRVRILGPEGEVAGATDEFKTMVETALKDAE
jgi:hypothetical protein